MHHVITHGLAFGGGIVGGIPILWWLLKKIPAGLEVLINYKEAFKPGTNGHTKLTKDDLKAICPINHQNLMAEIREDNRKNYESLRVEQREDFRMLHEDIERIRK
jgi:hypothetical protein